LDGVTRVLPRPSLGSRFGCSRDAKWTLHRDGVSNELRTPEWGACLRVLMKKVLVAATREVPDD
jgi:hypothetical protein